MIAESITEIGLLLALRLSHCLTEIVNMVIDEMIRVKKEENET